jgi:hypothetical protein
MRTPSSQKCRLDLAPPWADRFPIDYGPVLLRRPFGFHLTVAESARGISPRAAHRSGHEALASSGSCHPEKAAAFRQVTEFLRLPVDSILTWVTCSLRSTDITPLPRCRVGGGALARWPPSAAQTARTLFAYAAFTKTQSFRDANEGINPIKLTSPCSRYSVFLGSLFQPPFLQRLYRCDQIRRTIQPSSRWKSVRTWARL